MSECYSGVENLEAMQDAHNFYSYLLSLVVSEGRGVATALDFGAGIGTFASELRKYGSHVICIEPDRSLRRRLQIEQFEAHDSPDPIPEKSVHNIYSLNVLQNITRQSH